jgi:hypothetical protein
MGIVYAIDKGLSMGLVRILWEWARRGGGGVLAVSTTSAQAPPHKAWAIFIDSPAVHIIHELVRT